MLSLEPYSSFFILTHEMDGGEERKDAKPN